MKLEIIVVANKERKVLILPYLEGKSHKVLFAKDYSLPFDFKPNPNMAGCVLNHQGVYRCFRGHQDALSMSDADNILILEDDAVPINALWFAKILDAILLLDSFEVISFHGRDYQEEMFQEVSVNSEYIKPLSSPLWIVAALAYLVKRETVKKLIEYRYNGKPWDLVLYQHHSFCVLRESIFNHDRSEGSLID